MKTFRPFLISASLLLLVSILGLKFGAVSGADLDIIMMLRLPRIILAIAVGMGLAVAGAALQALFANPLCEPYTLGISSGSALGAILGGALGFGFNFFGMAGSGFLGALLFALVLYLLSIRWARSNLTLLLSGVMLSFFGSSLVAVWMALADPKGIQGALFWLLGDLSRARLLGSLITLALVLVLSFFVWLRSRDLDAMLFGEENARSLGVSVSRVRKQVVLLSSLIVGLTVSAAGMIGFVGLVIPHLARMWSGSLHKKMILLTALLGALALVTADLLARVLASPHELPVGVMTAIIGAPVFLWLMLKRSTA